MNSSQRWKLGLAFAASGVLMFALCVVGVIAVWMYRASPGPGSDRVIGTWAGTELTNNAVQFEFRDDGEVRAYDMFGTWTGTWRMTGETDVFFELTSPETISYQGQITGETLSGRAQHDFTGEEWTWQVTREGGAESLSR